jgi:hypothetical protein
MQAARRSTRRHLKVDTGRLSAQVSVAAHADCAIDLDDIPQPKIQGDARARAPRPPLTDAS